MTIAQISLNSDLSQWLTQLYVGAERCHPTEFKQWCFEFTLKQLKFDSALWATRSDLQDLQQEHWVTDTKVFNQQNEFMKNYQAIAQKAGSSDQLNQFLIENPSQFFTIWDVCPQKLWYTSDFYLEHCVKFGIEQAISAMTLPTKNSAVSHVISFYRANKDDEFSRNEILVADFVLPHLIEAFRHNVLGTFTRSQDKGQSFRAVLDRYGAMMEAEDGFLQLMQKHQMLNNSKVKIPTLNHSYHSDEYRHHQLQLNTQFNEGLFYVEASESSKLESLTKRELQILDLLSKDFNPAETAEFLSKQPPKKNLSANTVNTHRRNIYKKLGVSHGAAAAVYYLTHKNKETSFNV